MVVAVRAALDRMTAHPVGIFAVLFLAAFLEAWGDSFFQTSIHRSSGTGRILALLAGTVALIAYGTLVNMSRWDFGRLLGVYVVLFFVLAQTIAKIRFGQSPSASIYLGGSLIVAGGMVISFWK